MSFFCIITHKGRFVNKIAVKRQIIKKIIDLLAARWYNYVNTFIKGALFMCQKTILFTGFDPFGSDTVNPASDAVEMLPETIGNFRIKKLIIPTVFSKAADIVTNEIRKTDPAYVICVGLAASRQKVTCEVVGINLREASIADNEGNTPQNQPCVEGAPCAYFSTLPVREMVQAVNGAGVPAALSYTAGAFVCNDLLFTLLHRFSESSVKIGFIHVPCTLGMRESGGMPLEDVVKALGTAVSALEQN